MKWPEPQEPHSSLRVRGLNVRAHAVAPEKEKVSLTLDKPLVDEIRSQFGGRALSTSLLRRGRLALSMARRTVGATSSKTASLMGA
jgi:hypothetical protein